MKNIYAVLLVTLLPLCHVAAWAGGAEEEIGNGIVAIDQKRYDEAYDFFTRFLNDNPDNQAGLYYRSVAALGRKSNAVALSDINQAMKKNSGFLKKAVIAKDELLVQRGLVYKAMGDDGKATSDFSEALVVNPVNVKALVGKGQVEADMGQLEQADSDFKQALTIDEANLPANLGLARNMMRRSEYGKAISLLSKMESLYPQNDDIYTMRGDAYLVMGKYREAFDDALVQITFKEDYNAELPQLVARAIQCDTYSLPKISEKVRNGENIDLWLQVRAQMNRQLDRYDEAIADYDKLENELKDVYAPVCVARGRCKFLKGDYAGAETDFKKAIELEDTPEAYAAWALLKMDEQKPDSALALINKAIDGAPDVANYYLTRGNVYVIKKNAERAIRDYETGINVDRQQTPLLYAKARMAKGRGQDATADLNHILSYELLPQPQENMKPQALHLLGKDEAAVEWQDRVLKKFPTAANCYRAALLFASMNMKGKAVEMLQKAANKGYRQFGIMQAEPELSNLKDNEEYTALLRKWKAGGSKTERKIADTTADSVKTTLPVIPCTVDGMMLTFTTNNDTAQIFTISKLDVQMLLKYGYMQKADVVRQRDSKSLDIMGVAEGDQVVLRTFKWGNKTLRNVTATVVEDPLAPILLTQGMLNVIDK